MDIEKRREEKGDKERISTLKWISRYSMKAMRLLLSRSILVSKKISG